MQVDERRDLGVARVHRLARRVDLQHADQFEHVLGVIRREGLDDRPAQRQQFDQSFGGQHLERLAQRRPRDAEMRGQLQFRNPLAGRQLVLDDQIPYPRDDFLVQRRPHDLDRGSEVEGSGLLDRSGHG